MSSQTVKQTQTQTQQLYKKIKEYRLLYLIMIPGLLYFILFRYLPMFGAVIAFKDYNIFTGLWKSPWVGFRNFSELFISPDFWNIFKNTLKISFLKILFGFPFPIILAVLLNEIFCNRFKKLLQGVLYMPHFISWVVIGGIMINIFSPVSGLAGQFFDFFNIQPVNFLTDKSAIIPLVILSDIWKESGWGTIIFLAALTQIDPSLYEAGRMDGTNKFQEIIHITLPAISGVIVLMLILKIGKIMNAGFEQILVLQNSITQESIDIFDTYVYREGLGRGDYSFSAAVDLFKSVVGLILVYCTDKFSKCIGEEGLF